MASSLSNLDDSLAEGNDRMKCKYGLDNKNGKRVELNKKIVSAVTNTQALKMS